MFSRKILGFNDKWQGDSLLDRFGNDVFGGRSCHQCLSAELEWHTFVTFSDRCIQKFCGGYKAKSAKILRILASDSVACMLPVYYFSWLNQDLHGINVHIKCNWFLCIQFFSYDAGCCGAHDCCRWGKSCTSYSTTWCYMKYDTQKWRKVQKVDGRNK